MTNSVLFQSIGLHIGGLIFLAFTTLLYFRNSKKSEKTITKRFFIYSFSTTYAAILIEIASYIARHFYEIGGIASAEIWSNIFARMYIFICFVFSGVVQCYYSFKMLYTNPNKKQYSLTILIFGLFNFILWIISFFLKLNFHSATSLDRFVYSGPALICLYITFAVIFLEMVISFMISENIKKIHWFVLSEVTVGFILIKVAEALANYSYSEIAYIMTICMISLFFSLENTNYTSLIKLQQEEEEHRNLVNETSKNINNKTKEIIGKLNNSYILINLMCNSDNRNNNEDIETLLKNNNDILNSFNAEEEQ